MGVKAAATRSRVRFSCAAEAAAVGGELMGDSLEIKVRNILAEQLGVDLVEVSPDARILDDLGADSLDVVELVMSLEEAFDIEIPDEDVEELRTVADVERYVTRIAADV
jgi:acyl carrier protein